MRIDGRVLAAIFAGGFAGAVARAGLADALPAHAGAWPWATFLANVAGAFLLGVMAARGGGPVAAGALGAGFCGALTTFSTLQLELVDLLGAGDLGLAGAYGAVSVAAGLAAVAAGRRVAAA